MNTNFFVLLTIQYMQKINLHAEENKKCKRQAVAFEENLIQNKNHKTNKKQMVWTHRMTTIL